MRWNLLIAVFGLSITDVASLAQRPPDDQRLSMTRSSAQDAGFFASTGVVRFQLIQGRLCLDPPRHRKGSQNRDENGVYESITVTAERGIPSMHYVCQTPDHQLTLSVQRADSMRIESWFPKLGERAVLEQPAVGAITWEHDRGDLHDQHQGQTLLHLRHADPVNFDLHFGMLAQRLLRGQSLQALSEATRTKMLSQIETTATPDAETIQRCVDRLRSSRRAKRVEAERQLLAWGTPIVPTIQAFPSEELDSEQKERLRIILCRLRPRIDDSPATLAKLLINDTQYWGAVAAELSPEQIQLANRHLVRYGAEPLAPRQFFLHPPARSTHHWKRRIRGRVAGESRRASGEGEQGPPDRPPRHTR